LTVTGADVNVGAPVHPGSAGPYRLNTSEPDGLVPPDRVAVSCVGAPSEIVLAVEVVSVSVELGVAMAIPSGNANVVFAPVI
jgi:hypothetical protein